MAAVFPWDRAKAMRTESTADRVVANRAWRSDEVSLFRFGNRGREEKVILLAVSGTGKVGIGDSEMTWHELRCRERDDSGVGRGYAWRKMDDGAARVCNGKNEVSARMMWELSFFLGLIKSCKAQSPKAKEERRTGGNDETTTTAGGENEDTTTRTDGGAGGEDEAATTGREEQAWGRRRKHDEEEHKGSTERGFLC
ncbi:hypothetical protein PIB30_027157 [Stylosanthes scabra]|uniref:Uncharacterized protein n=1 Tax=Stylosanthes scabra TaxID=79078 RepID=A0ABU6Z9Q7_9FABA|nr:hypothetical protein [Stylosanthes scabra]